MTDVTMQVNTEEIMCQIRRKIVEDRSPFESFMRKLAYAFVPHKIRKARVRLLRYLRRNLRAFD